MSTLYTKFSSYSELREEIKEKSHEEQFRQHVIIFGLAWIVGEDSNLLAACTSSGELVIWKVPSLVSVGLDGVDCTRPCFRQKISNGKLYAIRLERLETKAFLVVSGDEGVLVYDWESDVIEHHLKQQTKTKLQSARDSDSETTLSPISRMQPYPSPLERRGIEVNDFRVLNGTKNNYLFGAAGDSFGAYKWDLTTGQLVKNYTSPGCGGYLHSVELLPEADGSKHQSILLTGGEGGRLEFWDTNHDKSIEKIDLTTVGAADASTSASSAPAPNPGSSRTSSKRSRNRPSRWISSICASSHNWVTVAGGSVVNSAGGGGSRGSTSSNGSGCGGFLGTYHAPTRSLVSWTDTRETPQQLVVLPSSMESPSVAQHSLVSVANEGVVSHFNALSLERTRRLWCTPPSVYACGVSGDGRHTAVAGVGCFVDIFDESGEKFLRLAIC